VGTTANLILGILGCLTTDDYSVKEPWAKWATENSHHHHCWSHFRINVNDYV